MRYLVPILFLTLSACNADKGCADRGAVPAKGRPATWTGGSAEICDRTDDMTGNSTLVAQNNQ